MKRLLMTVAAGLVSLAAWGAEARACDGNRGTRPATPAPAVARPAQPEDDDLELLLSSKRAGAAVRRGDTRAAPGQRGPAGRREMVKPRPRPSGAAAPPSQNRSTLLPPVSSR
jgi:hypothetical protein